MEKLTLREMIELLISKKLIIVSFAIAALVLATAYAFLTMEEEEYEAQVSIEISGFEEGEENSPLSYLYAVNEFPTETYITKLESDELLEMTIEDLGLEDELSVGQLSRKMNVEASPENSLLTVNITDPSAEKATRIAQSIGENFVALEQQYIGESIAEVSNQVEIQFINAQEELEDFMEEKNLFLEQPRGPEEVYRELQARITQITNYKTEITDLVITRESLTEAINVIESELENVNETLTIQGVTVMNELYTVLRQKRADLRAELQFTNAGIEGRDREIENLEESLKSLQIELNEKEIKQAEITRKEEILKQAYEAQLMEYEYLESIENSNVKDGSQYIKLRTQPVSSTEPESKGQIIAAAGMLGLVLGIFVVYFMKYWEITGNALERKRNNRV